MVSDDRPDDPRADDPVLSLGAITQPTPVYFLLAQPVGLADGDRPATIGERDLFFSEEAALDSLDVHYAWCAAERGGFVGEVTSALWYLQSAMVGPRVSPGLGEVYLAVVAADSRARAIAGGFLTEGELLHWSPFVRAVRSHLPDLAPNASLVVSHLGDETVSFGRIRFSPLRSQRVYPKQIVVEED